MFRRNSRKNPKGDLTMTLFGIPTTLGIFGLIIAAVVGLVLWQLRKSKNLDKGTMQMATFALGGLLLVSVVSSGLFTGEFDNPFAAGAAPAAPGVTAAPVAASPTAQPSAAPTNGQLPINTFKISTKEKHSNSQTNVGNDTDGFLNIYPPDQNPGAANANPVQSINVTSGTSDVSVTGIFTNTLYRVVFDGSGDWYDVDLGTISFDNRNYQENTATYALVINDIIRIALIDDPIDDGSTAVNGQSTSSEPSEVQNTSTQNSFIYNETEGDNIFFLDIDHGFSGSNREIKDAVNCIEYDSANSPEGTEVTGLTVSRRSGDAFPIDSDILNFWTNELCMDLGSYRSGVSGTYRYTITVDEAQLDTGADIWTMRLDDLGDFNARDVRPNRGAAVQTVTIDSGV